MKKLKCLKGNKELLGVFGFSFGFIYMLYSVFLNESYMCDHVSAEVAGSYDIWPDFWSFMAGGRIVSYPLSVLAYFLKKIGISKLENQFVLQIVTIILLACTVCVLYHTFQRFFKEQKEKMMLPMFLIIAFGNSFFGETFAWIGYELAFGILLSIFSVKLFVNKKYMLSVFGVLSSSCIYQSYIAIFLIYTCLYLYLDSEGKFEYKVIVNYLKIALVAICATMLNVFLAKIPVYMGVVESEIKKVSVSISFQQRIRNIMEAYNHILNTACGYYPKRFLLCLLIILFLCVVVVIWCKRKRVLDVLYFSGVFSILNLCYVAIFAILSHSWASQRITWPVFCCISAIFIIGLYYFNDIKWKKILIAVYICFMSVNIYYTQTAAMDFYISNKVDAQIVASVEKEIRNYEADTGNTVTTVATRLMPGARYYSNHLNLSYTITYSHKTLYEEWSNVELLSYFAGRKYKDIKMSDEIFEKYFSDVEYDVYIPSKQLVFEGDTLYWLIF